jgi:hypothetical protein
MARIRTIKPDIRKSRTVCSWPYVIRWTFAGLPGYLDDAGRGLDDVRLIKAELYPCDDDMTARKLEQHLLTIATNGPLCRYEVDGEKYLHIVSWTEHQRVNRPTPSRIPPCPKHEGSLRTHGSLTEDSVKAHARKGREGNKEQETPTERTATPPPLAIVDGEQTAADVIAAYCDAATGSGRPRPSERLRGKVGRDAKRLAAEGRAWPELIAAARRLGTSGWDDLDRELQKPQRGKPVGSGIASQPDEAYLQGGIFSDTMRRRLEREAREGESA